jgi:protein-S-isoprenylcysteine O-methyltransferase Ste14
VSRASRRAPVWSPALTPRTRLALLCTLATLVALWIAFGLVLEPEKEGSCVTGLYPGTYRDALVPAHLAAYLVLVGLIAWSHPPSSTTTVGLGLTALLVLISPLWFGPLLLLGLVAIVLSFPAGIVAVVFGVMLVRGKGKGEHQADDLARTLIWMALLIALPATFMGAYVNGAGVFCF